MDIKNLFHTRNNQASAVRIVPVHSQRQLRQFARFNIELYRDCPYSVPELIGDVVDLFTPSKNPSYECCEAACFLCYKGKQIAGRIAAIINHRANEKWGKKQGRFGYIDFIDDAQVSTALIGAASAWLTERGMQSIEGPLGFTDLDKEGMLTFGFDQTGTCTTIYNHAYYPVHLEHLGFRKEAEWLEYKLTVSDAVPEKVVKIARLVEARYGVKTITVDSHRQLIESGLARQALELINKSYKNLYGFSQLSPQQIQRYIDDNMSRIRLDLLVLVTDRAGRLIAFSLGIPSLSKAYQKCRGHLFPFGFIHLLRALHARRVDRVDLLLIAIDPQWQNKGVNSLIMQRFLETGHKIGCSVAECNPELEDNLRVQRQWQYFDVCNHKRRCAYTKAL